MCESVAPWLARLTAASPLPLEACVALCRPFLDDVFALPDAVALARAAAGTEGAVGLHPLLCHSLLPLPLPRILAC